MYGCLVAAQTTPSTSVKVSAGVHVLANQVVHQPAVATVDILTGNPADATNPRWDIVVADTAGTVTVIVGTPTPPDTTGVVPRPAVDYTTKQELGTVYVQPGATVIQPADVSPSDVTVVTTDVQTFMYTGATQYWTPPTWTETCRVIVVGGGGGGGTGGQVGAPGGGGGGGAACQTAVFAIVDLTIPTPIVVGRYGGGGTPGGQGGYSSFGPAHEMPGTFFAVAGPVVAFGGGGGAGGATAAAGVFALGGGGGGVGGYGDTGVLDGSGTAIVRGGAPRIASTAASDGTGGSGADGGMGGEWGGGGGAYSRPVNGSGAAQGYAGGT